MGQLRDYINQIQRDLELQSEEFRSRLYADFPHINRNVPSTCPSCGYALPRRGSEELKFCPFCGFAISSQDQETSSIKPLYKLPHYEDLEDETKAKIGTFERIYKQTFQTEAGRVLVEKSGFETLDYSPLVNPLASGLEIELGQSVGKLMCREYGRHTTLHLENKELDLSRVSRFSLREYELCMRYDVARKNVISAAGFQVDELCFKVLGAIIDVRNEASHKKYVCSERFFFFYENIYAFFEKYVDKLIAMKTQ